MNHSNFDTLPSRDKEALCEKLRGYFQWYMRLALLVELSLLGGTVATIVVWADSFYIWTQCLHLFIVLRVACALYASCCLTVDPKQIWGVDRYYQTLTNFSCYPSLGLWWAFGYISMILVYWWLIIADIVQFVANNNKDSAQIATFIVMDILFYVEHWFSHVLVRKMGIVWPYQKLTEIQSVPLKRIIIGEKEKE